MADTDLSPNDVLAAQQFMQQFLLTMLPDADVTEGSAEYDHLVKGFAYLFAYLSKAIGAVKARQSLLKLVNLPAGEDVDQAADALLANLFQSRSQGQFARGTAVVHLSSRTDFVVRTAARFFRTRALYYVVDAAEDYLVPASRLRPSVDASGQVIDWVGTVPLVAARRGAAYNVRDAGRFVNFERFNAFVTYIENTAPLDGGLDAETTSDFIERAGTAMSLQALINARSNSSVLRRLFSIIEKVTTFGYGDAEMVRDVVTDDDHAVSLHRGGAFDINVRTPLREVTELLTVGAPFTRADDAVLVFRHDNTVDFTTGTGLTGAMRVVVGDVLMIGSGLVEAPFAFKIAAVFPQELHVRSATPFSTATDESAVPTALTFSIGNCGPLFNEKHVGSGGAKTSRTSATSNAVLLSGGPVYRVKKVEILSVPAGFEAYTDPASGTLVFTDRVNGPPAVPRVGSPLQYRVECLNPERNQSVLAVTRVSLGWSGAILDDSVVEVTYDTLANFDVIDAYVRDAQNRPAAADVLPRADHPVYLAATVPYSLNASPVPFRGTLPTFDEAAATAALVGFVNSYAGSAVLDTSILATEVRARADTVAAVYPFTIDYDLFGPDGRVFHFTTTDRITVFPDGTHGARLTNPTDFGLPADDYYAALAALLARLGVSDRNVRYLTTVDEITFERRT